MKRLNLNLDETTVEQLETVCRFFNCNRTTAIKYAMGRLYREVLKELNLSPSSVGQQVGPTELGDGQHQEEN